MVSFSVDDMMRNSFVLCQYEREYDVFCRRMSEAGFRHLPSFFDCRLPDFLVPAHHAKQVTACVYMLVRMAKLLGLRCITIFECDCCPMRNCRSELDSLFSKGIPDDADLLTFGNLHWIRNTCNLSNIDDDCRFGVISGRLYGSHAVTYLCRGYDRYLSRYMDKSRSAFNCDHFDLFDTKSYSTTRSYFLQVQKTLTHSQWLTDIGNIVDFPVVDPVTLTAKDGDMWPSYERGR